MTSLTGRCQPRASASWLGCAGGLPAEHRPGTLTSAGAPGFPGNIHGASHMAGRDSITLQLEGW